MSNRSYLYSTNLIPRPDINKEERVLTGISEWENEIPFVYKLLLSENPKTCASSIWQVSEEIAIIAEYEGGVKRLENFLSQIEMPHARPFIEEALAFLHDSKNRSDYFILECGEIFDMEETPMEEQNVKLFKQIQFELEDRAEEILLLLNEKSVSDESLTSFFSRLFSIARTAKVPKTDPLKLFDELGLRYWSNDLFYDFKNS